MTDEQKKSDQVTADVQTTPDDGTAIPSPQESTAGQPNPEDNMAATRAQLRGRLEAALLELRFQPYQAHYLCWSPHLQSKCAWEEIQSRLLANNGHYLSLAEGLENEVLFGVDHAGNPLFADGGDQPLMEGMNYNHTRQEVVLTGYEMFPVGEELIVSDMLDFTYYGNYHKSSEIKQFEAFARKPFVLPEEGESWSSSWLESGERPFGACAANFSTRDGQVLIGVEAHPNDGSHRRGVRRLLRVKKTS